MRPRTYTRQAGLKNPHKTAAYPPVRTLMFAIIGQNNNNNFMKKFTLITLLSLATSFASPFTWSADFASGIAAYQAGDFKTALSVWKPLAQRGNVRAQNFLGFMYDNGEGVLEDDLEAVKWYRMAAEQGHAKAQYGLGVMFANGEGVPQSNVYAHMWWNVAASNGDKKANENKSIIARQMTPQELASSQKLAIACARKNYMNCYKRTSSTASKKYTRSQ